MTGIVIREINCDFHRDKIRNTSFFNSALTAFFILRDAKNETPVPEREPSENLRSEVIQTTCSASKRLTSASASSSKCGAVKNEQSLFIQSSAKQNSTAPRGPDSKYSRTQEPRLAKTICFFCFFSSFCFNSVTNST